MSSTPHANASHAARFGRKSSVDAGMGDYVSKEEKKKDFDALIAVADQMERTNMMLFVKNSPQELEVWRKLDRNGDGKSNLNELWAYIEANYPDLKVGAQRSFLPHHSIAERIAKVALRTFADSIAIDLTRTMYPEIMYSCPIVLRALLLFEHLDTDDNDSLTEQEFFVVCREFNKRNMFLDKLRLNISGDSSLEVCHEDALKTAFQSIYSKVDGDRNGKVNFTEFSSWIIRAITGFDEFFKSFVSSQARSEKPPLFLEDKVVDTLPVSPAKHGAPSRNNSVSKLKTASKDVKPNKAAVSAHGPLSPRHLTRQESTHEKAKAAVGSLKNSAAKLVQFDTKSKEAPEISKKARMEQEISRLSSREKNLAQQYFNMIDQNNDGVLTKLELQDFIVNKLGFTDEKEYVEARIEEADVDSPIGLDPTRKLIDLQEFMFGFQFLFKSRDRHFPEYLLASAMWSLYLERAKELGESSSHKHLSDILKKPEFKKVYADVLQCATAASPPDQAPPCGHRVCCGRVCCLMTWDGHICSLLNWEGLVRNAVSRSSTDSQLDDAMKGFKGRMQSVGGNIISVPDQRGVTHDVLENLKALFNFKPPSESDSGTNIAAADAGTADGNCIHVDVTQKFLDQKRIFETQATALYQSHCAAFNIAESDISATLRNLGATDNGLAKMHEMLLIDALIDHLLSVSERELLRNKPANSGKTTANIEEIRRLFCLSEDQIPVHEDSFMFPCTWDLMTLGRLYIFKDYVCFIDLGKFNAFKICFEDITSVVSTSLLLDHGLEISFSTSGKTLNVLDQSCPVKTPIKLKTFSWDLLDDGSRAAWRALTFSQKIDLGYLRDQALSTLSSRLVSLGPCEKPAAFVAPAYSTTEQDKHRHMFELSHKMIVTVTEFNEIDSGFFKSLAAKFKPKTRQLLVMEQMNRCNELLNAASTPLTLSPAAYPAVQLVFYDLRKTDTESWTDETGNRLHKFDYKSTQRLVDDELEDVIDFGTRRLVGNAVDLVLDIQLSADAPGGFVIVFKTKKNNKTVTVCCAEPADFRNAEEDPNENATRALHTFELIATACLAGNPDILSLAAHQLLCMKVLGIARPHNLGKSANYRLRYIENYPWQLQNLWQPPEFKLSVFFSSTFTDTKRERTVIMEKILPKLSERGLHMGVQCVFTDMRWGVLDQNTVDQDTWDVCDREIRRSERESCDLFFVSLQSEKYGYMPLPKCLPSTVASAVQAINDEHVRKLFGTWYKQDLNDVPEARFHLQPLSDINDKPYWKIALPVLGHHLSGLVFDDPHLIVGRSVTEWEFLRASQIGSRDRMFWFKREFDYEQDDDGRYWKDKWSKGNPNRANKQFFCDSSERSKLESLWRRMHFDLGPNFRHYHPKYSEEYVDQHGREITSVPLSTRFSHDIETLLSDAMDRVIAQKQRWTSRAGGLIPNFDDPLFLESNCTRSSEKITEMLFHGEMARRICSTFWFGSGATDPENAALEELAQSIVDAVNTPFDTQLTGKSDVMSPVIALIGPPCSGKTAVMARVYELLSRDKRSMSITDYVRIGMKRDKTLEVQSDSTTIIRFIGSSDSSTNVDAFDPVVLISGICEQIVTTRCCFDDAFQAREFRKRLDKADTYPDLCSLLCEMMEHFNVRVILDGLDELEDRFSARTLLHFIGDERFKSNNPGLSSNSPWSRFIVSCSSDQTLADVRSRGASSRLENIGAHVVKMPELTFDTQSLSGGAPRPKASCFIEHVLKHQRRQLQPFQLEYICQQLSAITLSSLSGHPLHDLPPSSPAYVNVLARQARRINNLDMKPFPDMNSWGSSFSALLSHCLFDSAEKNFGTKFVKGALFCVTSCRFGISDTELVDVLSQDAEIMAEINKYHKSSRISMHVWTKFKAFFNEQCSEIFIEQCSLSCWNSQQIRRIAESRYSINTSNSADAFTFFSLHRVLGLYFGWGLEQSMKVERLDTFKDTPKLPAVTGHKNDAAAWFPDHSNRINARRFQECAHHLLIAAGKIDDGPGAFENGLILFNLAYDELFNMTTIICSCILGLGGNLLGSMEDFINSSLFNHLSETRQHRANQYLLFFSSNFQSIVLHPRRELLATATEAFTSPANDVQAQHVRNDAFAVIRGCVSTAGVEVGTADWINPNHAPQLPSFPEKSFAYLNRLFSPPIAEPMQWPSTIPERLISAIAISPCSRYVVCLDAASTMKLAGEPLRGKGSFKILCSRFGEASAFDKELVLDAAHSHLTKHIALFPVANQSEPMLACAAGSKVYFYDVFRAHGHTVPHLPHTKEPLQRSSISCLAFAASGLYFSIGYSDGNVYVLDTSYVNAAIDGDGISVHECVFATPRDQSLSSVTAVAFGGQDENERIIVGDRCGHVVVSRPFRNNAANRNSEGTVARTLFLSNVLKMQWACGPSPSASVRCVALFYVQNVFYAAGSWKSDHRHAGKLKFFLLEQNTSAGARDTNNVAIEKATVDFPVTVPFFRVHVPADLSSPSVLTVCNDGNIRNLALLKILSIGSKKSIPVDGAQEQHDDGGPASSDIPDIVDFQAAVGSGVEVCACATFVSKSSLALALSNKMCKFLNIPDLKDENSSGSQQFVLGWSDVSAIDFIPPASSRKLYTVAFVCNHPRPNSLSFISALGYPVGGQSGVCSSDQLYEKKLCAFCISPCGRVLITSGKERMPESERAIWIERVSFWTAADDGSPAKWTQQHYLQCQTKEHKFSPGGEHTRLVTALAACSLPEAWPDRVDGLFLIASASHDENDSEEGNNSRGVIKLRLLTAKQLLSANQLDKRAAADAKNRATSVICSLVCDRRHGWLHLAKNLTLSMCEGPDFDDGSKRGIYVTASIDGGFCAWCITAADFSSMTKGTAKTITSFKHYLRENSLARNAHNSCIVHAGPAPPPPHLHSPPSPPTSNKAFVISCHPEEWAISVTELAKLSKLPINELMLAKVVAAVGDLKSMSSLEQKPRMHVAPMPCNDHGVRFAFSVSVPERGCSCGILTMKAAMSATREPFTTAVQMLPLNPLLEIKALAASHDGACVAAVMTDGSVVSWTAAEWQQAASVHKQ